ncbi:MAG: sigma-70 family RNA polymerase sigma factor [Tenericutes bacterium]|jgi:RNA polymerase primary sigma factor|nr:sigma-70 family RNA polymerase sigma factor [Mycoplasmatota bacterium]
MTTIKTQDYEKINKVIEEYSVLNLEKKFYDQILENLELAFKTDQETKTKANLIATFRRLIDNEIISKIQKGDKQLKKAYILKNISLIISVKNKNTIYNQLTEDEAISAGVLALDLAIKQFQFDKMCLFSTYAIPKITNALNVELGVLNNNGFDSKTAKKYREVKKIKDSLEIELSRKPSAQEIADSAKMSVSTVNQLLLFDSCISLQGNDNYNNTTPEDYYISIDKLINVPNQFSVEEQVENNVLKEILYESFTQSRLTYREKTVLIERYGLESRKFLTLKEVGEQLDLSKQRIRQIELNALNKIKSRRKNAPLKIFLKK